MWGTIMVQMKAGRELEKWLDEVKGRLEKATPGPWESNEDPTWGQGLWGPLHADTLETSMHLICKTDADLIAAAPTDLKRAVRIIEHLQYALKTVERVDTISKGDYANKIAAMSDEELWK